MKKFLKNYGFIIFMLVGIIAGCIVGMAVPVVKDQNDEVISQGAKEIGRASCRERVCCAV